MREGEYSLIKVSGNLVFVSYSQNNKPPQLYCLIAKNIDTASCPEDISFTPLLLDQVKFDDHL